MTAPPRARLVDRVLALVAAGVADPPRARAAVAGLLDAGGDTDASAVVRRLESGAVAAGAAVPAAGAQALARRLADSGAAAWLVGQASYPSLLEQAWPELGAPLWLFTRSPAAGLPTGRAVAVVGTRRPSLDGLRVARDLGRLLAASGVTVVSGLARGIDQAAHDGALLAGGPTVGVLGTGFGVDYPHRSAALRERVARAGGLVTEYPPGVGARPHHFLWRNRIVSGLADATVVVEGRERSGALQTARLAAGQGREVLAVPGSINQPTSRAPLALLRDGARPVTRLEDVLDALPSFPRSPAPGGDQGTGHPCRATGLGAAAAAVLALLGATPATPGALAGACGLPVSRVTAAVAELSGRGLARTTPRGVVAAPGTGGD